MGYLVELNTLLGVPRDFNISTLIVGHHYTIIKERERAFPLHIAMLIVDSEWNFYGYAMALSIIVKDHLTQIEFEVLSLFTPEESQLYKNNFLKAAKITGEIK
jgi:hypothetical protein